MPKLLCIFLLVPGCLLVSCGVQEVVRTNGLPPAATDTISLLTAGRADEFLHSLSPQTFNGAVVLLKDGKLINGNGYGYAWFSQKLPFTTKTVSNTAYLARQFTAASVLKLQANKKLSLNDSLSMFFPEIPKNFQGIKLIHLLQNTSGLPHELAEPGEVRTKESFLEAVWGLSLVSAPGKEYHYSDLGYRLLAAVTEAAAGTEYEVFLRDEILIPSGMYYTGYVLPDFQQALLAKSKETEEEEFLYLQYKQDPQALWHIKGSSGMLSNAEDMFLWLRTLFNGELLPAQELEIIRAASFSGPENKQAFGWTQGKGPGGEKLIFHNSSQNGYLSQLMYFPEENISLVLLANQVNGQVEKLGEQLVRIALFPFYVPAPLPYSEEKLVRIPQEGEAEHVRALINYIQDNKSEPVSSFIKKNFSPGFRSLLPEKSHQEALEKLQQRLGKARLEKAEQKLPFYLFTYFSAGAGFWYQLRVQVDPLQAYKIKTIGLETTDALN